MVNDLVILAIWIIGGLVVFLLLKKKHKRFIRVLAPKMHEDFKKNYLKKLMK